VGLLSWLGLNRDDEHPNVDALLAELKRALPNNESVVLRYIAAVVVLLGKVANADGNFNAGEEASLRNLLARIEGLSPENIEAVTRAIAGKMPDLREDELDLCMRELKALCDGKERVEVFRLLAEVALSDGKITPAERAELKHVADELGVPKSELNAVEEKPNQVT